MGVESKIGFGLISRVINLEKWFQDLSTCLVEEDELPFPFYSNIVPAELKALLDTFSFSDCRRQLRSFPLNVVKCSIIS